MPRSRKTKTNPTNQPAVPSKPAVKTPDHAPKPDLIDQLFNAYASKSSGMIEPEGVESLCSDLGLNPMDVRVLMLAWKMGAKTQGYFTLDEWRKALRELKVGNINRLKASLVELEKEVKTPPNFVEFYSYAFRYCLTEERQRTLEIESVCTLLELLFLSEKPEQVEALVEYLKTQKDVKVITMDQWMGFHLFLTQISFPDLGNYNSEEAWPVIIDDFVDWRRAKQNKVH